MVMIIGIDVPMEGSSCGRRFDAGPSSLPVRPGQSVHTGHLRPRTSYLMQMREIPHPCVEAGHIKSPAGSAITQGGSQNVPQITHSY